MSAINAYFDNLSALLARTAQTQAAGLEEASQQIAKCLKGGGMVYTFGTGHGHLLALEIFYRAGGMVRLCPILDEKLMLHLSAAGSTLEERDEKWVDILLEKYPIKAGDFLQKLVKLRRPSDDPPFDVPTVFWVCLDLPPPLP